MISHRSRPAARRRSRGAARAGLAAAAVGLVAVVNLSASAAFADVPVGTGWKTPAHVSGFKFLLVLFLIPAGLAIVIAVLAALPSIISGSRATADQTWQGDSLWFGGPLKGVEAADAVTPAQLEAAAEDRGGASARW